MRRPARLLLSGFLILAAGCADDPSAPTASAPGPQLDFLADAATLADSIGSFAGGRNHMCGVAADGAIYCSGSDQMGQLGGDAGDPCPGFQCDFEGVEPTGSRNFRFVAAGEYHTCGITAAGRLYCWGRNTWGQLGIGVTGGDYVEPQLVDAPGVQFVSVDAGWYHTCAITTQGFLYCWGSNYNGELGDPADGARPTPARVGTRRYAMVAIGGAHTCGLDQTGRLFCWGWNAYGQVGAGFTSQKVTAPTRVGRRTYTRVSAGDVYTCAIAGTTSYAWCWGGNSYGELGDSVVAQSSTPHRIAGSRRFREISLGAYTSCGILIDGRIACWGRGDTGMLGTGDSTSTHIPVVARGPRTYRALGTAMFTACAVADDGQAYCWGGSWFGLAMRDPATTTTCYGDECQPVPRRTAVARLFDAP